MKIFKLKSVFFLICLFSFISCKREPTSCFSYPDKIIEGEPIDFNNCSTEGKEFEWDFGDGTSSTINRPSHIYGLARKYTVSLTVRNGNKSASSSQEITVEPPTGTLTFWARYNPLLSDSIIVNTSAGTGYITSYFLNQISVECGTSGCANFTLPANQSYHYQVNNLSGDVTVLKSQCKSIMIY